MDISLDSVATHLWHGGTFKYDNQKFTRASRLWNWFWWCHRQKHSTLAFL